MLGKQDYVRERFGEPIQVQCENLMVGTLQFACRTVGNLLFDSNSIFILPEKPRMVLFGSYIADPNQFVGEVKIIFKGNNESFVVQQSHVFSSEFRGLGVAEMTWSMRMGRINRANKEMAYHAREVLHRIVKSSETKANQRMESTSKRCRPFLAGILGKPILSYGRNRIGPIIFRGARIRFRSP